jgi:hypothetical protein
MQRECPPHRPVRGEDIEVPSRHKSREHHQRNLRDGPAQNATRSRLSQETAQNKQRTSIPHTRTLPRRHGLRDLVDYTPSPDHQG